MKKIILVVVVIATLFFLVGCTIHVVPLNDGRIPLPPASYGVEFNTYGSGWGWPFLRWPGIGWGYYGGYGYPHYGYGGYGPRWVPGFQRWVCEGPPSNRCYWIWEPAHYE